MKLRIAMCLIVFAFAAWPQSDVQPGSQPSPMEAFANTQGARIIWFNEVGRMEHDGRSVVITALALQDSAQPAHKMRGVKIDLSSRGSHDTIYLDEESTARTRAALEEIANAVSRSGGVRASGCTGAKEFWPLYDWPWNKYHELNVDYCGDTTGSALVLYGRGKSTSFRFEGEHPMGLAGMLGDAMEQLKQH